MADNSYMKMYWGDYLRDTQGLSQAQHGAYLLLISHYWNTGGLPSDIDEIYIVGMAFDKKSKQNIDKILKKFFKKTTVPDGKNEYDNYQHSRIDEELKKAEEAHNKRVLAGSKGGKQKAENPSNAKAMVEQSSSKAPHNHNHNHNQLVTTTASKEAAAVPKTPPLFEKKIINQEPIPEAEAVLPEPEIPQAWIDFFVRSGETADSARTICACMLESHGKSIIQQAMSETIAKKVKKPIGYFRTVADAMLERLEAHGVPKNAHGGDDAENTVEAKLEDGKVVRIVNAQASKLLRAKAVKYMKNCKIYSGEELRHQLFLIQDLIPMFYLPNENELVSIGQLQVVEKEFAEEELALRHWSIPQSKRAGKVA